MTPTPETFEAWNENMSCLYDPDAYFSGSNMLVGYVGRCRLKTILRLLKVRPDDRVLDVGCGKGHLLQHLSCGERCGVDLSEHQITIAKHRLGDSCAFFRMPAEKLDFPDASFDKIICSEVLEHVLEPRNVLSELRRVVRPGGHVVITIPNESMIKFVKKFCMTFRLNKLLQVEDESGEQRTMQLQNPWHLHDASLPLFREWNEGMLHIASIKNIPAFLPLHYALLLKRLQ